MFQLGKQSLHLLFWILYFFQGMGIYLPSMKMEVGIAIEDILGAEVVGEGVVHVAVDVEDTMGPKMEVMDMKHPVKAVVGYLFFAVFC